MKVCPVCMKTVYFKHPSCFFFQALFVLGNIAWHGAEACDYLVQHNVLQSVVPILKSSDVELLNLSLDFSELTLRMTETVSSD